MAPVGKSKRQFLYKPAAVEDFILFQSRVVLTRIHSKNFLIHRTAEQHTSKIYITEVAEWITTRIHQFQPDEDSKHTKMQKMQSPDISVLTMIMIKLKRA